MQLYTCLVDFKTVSNSNFNMQGDTGKQGPAGPTGPQGLQVRMKFPLWTLRGTVL